MDQEEAEERMSVRHDFLQALCSPPPAPSPASYSRSLSSQEITPSPRSQMLNAHLSASTEPPTFPCRQPFLPSQPFLLSPDPLGRCFCLPSLLSTPCAQQESSSNLFLQKHESTLGDSRARVLGAESWNILFIAVRAWANYITSLCASFLFCKNWEDK